MARFWRAWFQRWHLSLFEKVILVNSVMLIGEALAGLWVTSHNLEAHHYLIDTSFIVLATLLTLFTNVILLRVSFLPLFGLLATIREVSGGKTRARASVTTSDPQIGELAHAFNTMLDRLETARREQTTLILQAQEEQRRSIALELHDETGQNLTALLIHAEVLHQSLQALPEPAIAQEVRRQMGDGLAQLAKLTQDTLENIRLLAQQLRPSVLDDLGLLAALRWLVEDSQQRLHLAVELEVDAKEQQWRQLPPVYETALFRIAQESLTNVARHAHAQRAWISLRHEQGQLRLQIRDDGRGYTPGQEQAGLGVFGMRERASLLGGTLTVLSHSGQGTTVLAILPLPTLSGEQAMPIEQAAAEAREEKEHVC